MMSAQMSAHNSAHIPPPLCYLKPSFIMHLIDLTSTRSQVQLTVKLSILSLYINWGRGTPPKEIDLTSARSQEQLTVKPSVLSLYSPTMGDSPLAGHRFGYRFGQVQLWGTPPSLVTGSVTGPDVWSQVQSWGTPPC